MLLITPQHRLLLAIEPIDFRKGIDSISSVCKQKLAEDPFQAQSLCLRIVEKLRLKSWCKNRTDLVGCHVSWSTGSSPSKRS